MSAETISSDLTKRVALQMTKERLSFQNLKATRIIATAIGVFLGLFSSVNHGFFEFFNGLLRQHNLVLNTSKKLLL